MAKTLEIDLDSRGRAPLGKVATAERYRVAASPEGVLTLTPVRSYTDRELAVLTNPKLLAQIKEGLAEAHAGKVTPYDPHAALAELGGPDDEDQ